MDRTGDAGRVKVLVLGGAGMLGHKMFQAALNRGLDVSCTISRQIKAAPLDRIPLYRDRTVIENVDASDFAALAAMLRTVRPTVVVNCIGVIKQRREAASPIPSITINSLLPHRLAATLSEWGGRLIHFSTDCVFSGLKGGYVESDISDARDLYGRTKYLGEVATDNALTLRTSIIGRELSNFSSLLEWFLAQNGQTVTGYTRAIYSGVTTNYLSDLVCTLLLDYPQLCGLYQVASPAISKFELLHMIRDAYKLNVTIIPSESEICDRSMKGEVFREVTGVPEPAWNDMICQMVADSTPYDDWR